MNKTQYSLDSLYQQLQSELEYIESTFKHPAFSGKDEEPSSQEINITDKFQCLKGWIAYRAFIAAFQQSSFWDHPRFAHLIPPRRDYIRNILSKPPTDKRGTWFAQLDKVPDVVVWAAARAGLAFMDTPTPTLLWLSETLSPSTLSTLRGPYTINVSPGMHDAATKTLMSRHLNRCRELFPSLYRFVPPTLVLPEDTDTAHRLITDSHGASPLPFGHWIIKPSRGLQGQGIRLIPRLLAVPQGDVIIQAYVPRPLLLDRLKFDLRIYVLVTSWSPLVVWRHEEGLARFATEPYESPPSHYQTPEVADPHPTPYHRSEYMHLTNYSLNKKGPKYVPNTDPLSDTHSTKRSLSTTLAAIAGRVGADATRRLMTELDELVAATLAALQPSLALQYETLGTVREAMRNARDEDTDGPGRVAGAASCAPSISGVRNHHTNPGRAFHVIGFDVMVDEDLRPWLLEINAHPSLQTPEPVDWRVKSAVLTDVLSLVTRPFHQQKATPDPEPQQPQDDAVFGTQCDGFPPTDTPHRDSELPASALGPAPRGVVEAAWTRERGPARRFRGLRLVFDGRCPQDLARIQEVAQFHETMAGAFLRACGYGATTGQKCPELSSARWARFCRLSGIVGSPGANPHTAGRAPGGGPVGHACLFTQAEADLLFTSRVLGKGGPSSPMTYDDFVDVLHFNVIPRLYQGRGLTPLECLRDFVETVLPKI